MMNENMKISEKNMSCFEERAKLKDTAKLGKKYYTSPSLKSLGELSIVTLGGSIGSGDSGCSGPQCRVSPS